MPATRNHPSFNASIYFRLIAIWVLCEAMLGAIIHGFRIPVSGLVMGSAAIACICLIGWYAPGAGKILKATIIVAIFKMLLSPQAPPPAYIAVFFQGFLGELLFRNRKHFTFSCVLLAVLGLVESGLQRIIALTIIYGNDLWRAVNDFINGLTRQKQPANYSYWIAVAYTLIHIVAGLLVGWWVSRLPKRVIKWKSKQDLTVPAGSPGPAAGTLIRKRKKRRITLFIIWILFIALYVQSYYGIGNPLLPPHVSLRILLRSFIIVLAWVFIVGPLLKKLLHGWLRKKKTESAMEIAEVEKLLPQMQQLVYSAWKKSESLQGTKRLALFCRTVAVNVLSETEEMNSNYHHPLEIYILTAPVQSGKTTSLVRWSENRNDVHGILTPVVDGKRVFMNAQNRQLFRMEAKDDEDVLVIGRYRFSKSNFGKAISIIRQNMNAEGWLVIDEIGPMEISREGFHDVLKEIIASRKGKLLLVVRDRDQMVEKTRSLVGLPGIRVISNTSQLV